MYANVYIDPKSHKLGIAVYAYGKIPGFSRMVRSPEEQEAIRFALEETFGAKDVDTSKAFNIFHNLALDDSDKPMKGVELQRGNIFSYEKFKDRLDILGGFGEYFQNKVSIFADLDDPMMWFGLELANTSSRSEAAILEELPQQEKIARGEKIRQQHLKSLVHSDNTTQFEEALRRLYILISRSRHFGVGPKDYSTSNPAHSPPSPPTFLISKEMDFVFYPGFRGGISMTRLPTDKKMIFPISKPGVDPTTEKKWASILVPDIRAYLQDISLEKPSSSLIMELDYVTEATAQTFYNSITVPEPSYAAFEKALIPTRAKAVALLERLEKVLSTHRKIASSGMIETWIDLSTGQIFKSEEQLLASMRSSSQEQQEKLPLAAHSLRRIANILIRHKRLRSIFNLMKE
jgi:hypothetical protein